MKLVLSTSPTRYQFTGRLFPAKYLTPVWLAMVLLLGLLGASFFMLPGVPPGQLYNEPIDVFLKKLEQQYDGDMYADAGYVTVHLSNHTLYRLYKATTYQEVATLDSSLVPLIARELGEQGIEYEVFKNNRAAFLIGAGEWIISWGGLLYVPEVAGTF